MGDHGAFRSEPVEGWPLDLHDPSQVLQVLRRASLELVRADSQVELAEARARDAEERLARVEQEGASAIEEAERRYAELQELTGAEQLLLSERLGAAEAAHEEAQEQAAAEYRSLEQRAVQAEVLASMYQEKSSRLEQQAREAEERAELSEARARKAEQRVDWIREVLGREDWAPDPLEGGDRPAATPVLETSAEYRPLDGVALSAARILHGPIRSVIALGQGRSLRLGAAALGCAALLGLMTAGAMALITPRPVDDGPRVVDRGPRVVDHAPRLVDHRPRPVRLASSDAAALPLPAASLAAVPEPAELIRLEPPPPVDAVDLEAFLKPEVGPEPHKSSAAEPAPRDPLPALDFARADLRLGELPSMSPPEPPRKSGGKGKGKLVEWQPRVLARPTSMKLPQPAEF